MRLLLSTIVFAAACFVDVLDGDIESPQGCCFLLPRAAAASACFVEFVEPGRCQRLTCVAVNWRSEIVCAPANP